MTVAEIKHIAEQTDARKISKRKIVNLARAVINMLDSLDEQTRLRVVAALER